MSLLPHNGALAVLEMQFPGKIMQGVKGCVYVCVWRGNSMYLVLMLRQVGERKSEKEEKERT